VAEIKMNPMKTNQTVARAQATRNANPKNRDWFSERLPRIARAYKRGVDSGHGELRWFGAEEARILATASKRGSKKWRQASLPAVEGGFQPPGLEIASRAATELTGHFSVAVRNPPGWKPGSTSAKMADATLYGRALDAELPTSD
jgi:hypothetical protein